MYDFTKSQFECTRMPQPPICSQLFYSLLEQFIKKSFISKMLKIITTTAAVATHLIYETVCARGTKLLLFLQIYFLVDEQSNILLFE